MLLQKVRKRDEAIGSKAHKITAVDEEGRLDHAMLIDSHWQWVIRDRCQRRKSMLTPEGSP